MSLEERMKAVELINEAVAGGARRIEACRMLKISMRTLQRWERNEEGDRRHGPNAPPANTLSGEERAIIVRLISSAEYRNLPPSQIVPSLADKGIYVASESTIYRIMCSEKLLEHRGRAHRACRHRPKECIATAANQLWSWDITYLLTSVKGRYYYLYLVIDVWSRKIVGWSVQEEENGEHASVLIRIAALREGIDPGELILHSDNGGPMKGATMLATLQWLGIVPSFSRPKVSDDNPYSESLFRTLKYRPEYPAKPFADLDSARRWVAEFVNWYNTMHRHSAIRFVTPAQRHHGEERAVLAKRQEVYCKAKEANPNRWSGSPRNWEPVETVVLNPIDRKVSSSSEKAISA